MNDLTFVEEYRDEVVDSWTILIVDDDVNVHITTEFALKPVIIHGKKLEFLHAYTGQAAREMVENSTQIDLMFLDAIMESATAGLDCAAYIKKVLCRDIPTIVMRTGFAGWEIEADSGNIECIDDFLLKSKTTRETLILTLEKWLPKQISPAPATAF